jgi:hypothetical protein
MKPVLITAAASTLFVLVGCAAVAQTEAEKQPAMNKAASDDPIAMATSVYEKAEAAGCAWRDTGKMLKKAKELLAAGETEKAHSMAKKAQREAENGLKQCDSEKKRLDES